MRIGLPILLCLFIGVLAQAEDYPKFIKPDEHVCAARLADHHEQMINNWMKTNRNFETTCKLYVDPRFREDVNALGPDDQWMDSGSGEGLTLADYQKWGKARTLGVVIELPKGTKKVSTARHRILDKRYIEEIPPEEIGETALVTDGMGPTAYAFHFHEIINLYLKVVKNGGVIWLALDNEDTKIHTKDAGTLSLAHYLKLRLKGHNVDLFGPNDNVMRIQLTEKGPRQLKSLTWKVFATANPPYREYTEAD